jgi:CRISPR/Cas system CMR subunit Cmr4 (Cas7 group RAMP superfamily)
MELARVFELETRLKETSREIEKIRYHLEHIEITKIAKKHNMSADDKSSVVLRMGTIEILCNEYKCKVTVEYNKDADPIDILLDQPNKKIVIYVSSDSIKEMVEAIAKKRNLTIA